MLVYFVEQQLEGWTFARAHWPLHITLVPWFVVNDEEAVIRSLERLASRTEPVHLGVGEEDRLGSRRQVPVNLIANQRPIRRLHEKLLATLNEADVAFHEERFTGQHYVAHITRHKHDGRHCNEGEELTVTEFQLVRLLNRTTCRVEQQFNLRQSY